MWRCKGNTQNDGEGHGQDAWAAVREKFDGCSCETLQAAQQEIETVKMRSNKDPNHFFEKKDSYRDCLNSVTPIKGTLDHQDEDIILQCLSPEYHRTRQTYFEREDYSLADIRRMMSKIYAGNRAHSNSDSSRGITGRGVVIRTTGRDLSSTNCHYCNKFGHYKNDWAELKAAHQ